MAKFLIQDIMPPEKQKRTKKPQVKEEVHDSSHIEPHDDLTNSESNDPYLRSEAVVSEEAYTQNEDSPLQHGENTYSFEHTNLTPQTEQFFSRISSRLPTSFSRPSLGNSKLLLQAIFAIIILLVGYISYAEYFAKAVITITPKQSNVTISESVYRAQKDPQSDNLNFSVMEIELSETVNVPATGNKTVTEKASGKIVVYNEYSTSAQRLIKNTRFQIPSGKIYRINESIVVPGMKKESGKTIPGSIEVTVYADEPGPSYNSDPTDLTIPGLKSDPERYKMMYARSKTAFTGGKEGIIKSVSDADMKKADEELTIALETKLRAKARGNLSGSQVVFSDGMLITPGQAELIDSPTGDEGAATVQKKGMLSAVVFDKNSLARAIARKEIPEYQEEDVSIPQLENLIFTLDPDAKENLPSASQIDFMLSGNLSVVWSINSEIITSEILGVEKRLFNNIMAKQGTIENAEAKVTPFWHSTFPKNKNDISIVLKNEGGSD